MYKYCFYTLQVVFLLVSDDMDWTKKYIYESNRHKYNMFLAGSGNAGNYDRIGRLLLLILLF